MHHWNEIEESKEQHFILQSQETLEYIAKNSYIQSGVIYRGETSRDARDAYIFPARYLNEDTQAFCDKNYFVILGVVCIPTIKTVMYRPGMVTKFTNAVKAMLAGATKC